MRADAELLIYIDIERSLADGAAQWWISDNGVVLSEGGGNGCVETRYWKRVVGRKEDVGVLWEDGVMKAELPEAFRGRKAPAGKGPRRAAVEGKAKGRKGRKGEGGERAMEMRVTLGDQEPGGGAVDNGGDP
jgi:2'-phosphotransferase